MIEAKLEETRRQLLDLTRGNRLLNHRDKGQRTLRIVDEIAEEVYRLLVTEGETMQFMALEEAPEETRQSIAAEDVGGNGHSEPATNLPEPQLPLAPIAADEARASRHVDLFLQTALSGEQLQTRLVHLAREAGSSLQEQGCNILYLTLGMVQWQEAGGHGPVCRAPVLFVPVELQRKNVQSRYFIRQIDDDIRVNPCLVELCQRQFGCAFPDFDPDGDLEVDDYLQEVRNRIQAIPGWGFSAEIHLGLFSFSKLLMYLDLDDNNWPADRKLIAHPLIRRLTGIESEPENTNDAMPDPATLDDTVSPDQCYQVMDADSSQQAVILAAKKGLNMVVDGPPGTGKSQTITNIIAECLSAGKSVLFVAEKSAALEVVRRRLAGVGLGDFVLEMHSRKASRKSILQELRRVLEKTDPAPRARDLEAKELERCRQGLNDYVRQLHAPLGRLGISPFAAISQATTLAGEVEATCQIPNPLEWPPEQLTAADDQLNTLDRRLAQVGDEAQHPWRGVGPVRPGLETRQQIVAAGSRLADAIQACLSRAAALVGELGAKPRTTLAQIEQALADGRLLLEAPRLSAASLADSRWNGLSPALQRWLNLGMERQKKRAQWKQFAKDEAEQIGWRDVLGRRDAHKASLVRFLRPSWYRDGRLLRANLLSPELPAIEQQLVLLQQLITSADLRAKIEAEASLFADLFGACWTGPDSDWTLLRRYAEAAVAIRQLIIKESVPSSVAQKAVVSDDRAALGTLVSALQESLAQLRASWGHWLEAIASTEELWLGGSLGQADLAGLRERLLALPATIERLADWLDLRVLITQCGHGPLESFVGWAASKEGLPARGRLAATFKRHFYRLWLDRAMAQRPALLGFRGDEHDASVKRFGVLDHNWLAASRDRLSALIAQARPDIGHLAHKQSKLGILQAEIRKKARQMPLRRLLSSVGDVVQSIKPCFMMSPLSVAQYLAPGCIEFDVVIFDEASQIEPADAYGAIARGRQVLLVGDENQLPPTNFFAKADAEEANDEADGSDVRTADLESILSLGVVRFAHRSSLRWHYRSRHASLIQFSNEKFYDGRLRVFPSPDTDCSESGVSFRFVESAIYKRGSGRYNPVEAAAVARAVIEHARTQGAVSLGVGTLNAPQQQAIEDEIERLRREAPDEAVEKFLADDAKEPFFVKNLESIQGDERDVIFLSVGYGPDGTGRPISTNFGALNRDGGWRRLNVLVTRARRKCVVFSSFHADDLPLAAGTPRGVVALKEYIYLAEHGQMKDSATTGEKHDSEFEDQVCRALRGRGWEIHTQIGCAGFSVDLAAVDPDRPGRYLLGIECDGRIYHSSPTARDRDRLRQEVLEGLGWKIHRVWSTDWFHRPRAVLDALLARLDVLRHDASRFTPPQSSPPSPTSIATAPAQAQPPDAAGSDDAEPPMAEGVVAYERLPIRRRGDQARLLSMPTGKLADLIVEMVNTEGPVHTDEIVRVVAEMFSTRASVRSREACDKAIQAAAGSGQIRRRGEFLWRTGDAPIRVRYRGNGSPVVRPELIAPEEYDTAVRLVLEKEFGLRRDSLAASTTRVMGFRRRGGQLQPHIDAAIERLINSGEIVCDHAGFLVFAGKR